MERRRSHLGAQTGHISRLRGLAARLRTQSGRAVPGVAGGRRDDRVPGPGHPVRHAPRQAAADVRRGLGDAVERFNGFTGDPQDLFFTDGGKTLVTVDHDRQDAAVRIWDVATGRVAVVSGRGGAMQCLVLPPVAGRNVLGVRYVEQHVSIQLAGT